MQGLINACWSCFKWGLLLSLIGGLVAVPWLYHRVDEEIRLQVHAKLAEHYHDLSVTVRFAKLVEGEGIEVRGISIVQPGVSGPQAELAYIDELFLACDTQLHDLVMAQPNVRQIVMRRPRIRMTRQADNSWSAACLWPPPRLSERPADVVIEGASLEIVDPLKETASTLTLRDVRLSVEHRPVATGGADSSAAIQHSAGLRGTEVPLYEQVPPPLQMNFRGELTGDYLRHASFEGSLEPESGRSSISGTAEGLDLSPELIAALPSQLSNLAAELASLRAQANVKFQVAHKPDIQPPWQFEVVTQVSRGRLDHPRLPYPLTDLRATVTCDHSGLRIDDLWARNGQSTFKLSCLRQGYDAASPTTLTVEGTHVAIDRPLFENMPEAWQQVWYKFMPLGEVNATARLVFDGTTWQPDLDIRCLNVSFLHHEFPYRLERGTGFVRLKAGVLTADLTAYTGGAEVRVAAEIQNPGSRFTGHVDLVAPNLPLDDKLLSAMKEKQRDIFRSLNPRGTVNCRVRCHRAHPDDIVHKEAWGRLNRCSMVYDKFPYPLANITGDFSFIDGAWRFTNLRATNDTGVVACNGGFTPNAVGGELLLRFAAANVPLEEELRDALDPRSQQLWDLLRPRGAFDLPMLEVRYVAGQKRPEVTFRLEPRTGATNTSIEPTKFPYRMERLEGSLLVREGHVEIERLRAEHGRTILATRGSCQCTPEGGWRLNLQDLTVDRLRLDSDLEFVAALPERLRKSVAELDPRGPLFLTGQLEFVGQTEGGQTDVYWNLDCQTTQGSLDAGILLEHMHGGVQFNGSFTSEGVRCRGELHLDSLTYRDVQLTNVAGPLWIDDAQVILGEPAQPGKPPRPITARLYGGTASGDAWVSLGGTPRYSLRAALNQVDLARYTQESVSGRQDLKGKVMANVELGGVGRGLHTLRGRGNVRLRDADIYELPLMVALLKILSVKPPDTTAFTASDIDFHIEGSHVYLDKMNFTGDAISLLGSGEMNFDQEIGLTFHAMAGRGEWPIPVLGQLAKMSSQQVMKITVTGTIDSPVPKAEAFPGVNQAFKDLEAGFQPPNKRKK